jgi:hypothetical protein
MTYVKIANQQFEATISGNVYDRSWSGRDSKTITCALSYEEAKALFISNTPWYVVYEPESYVNENGEIVTPEVEVYDNSDYCVAGAITDTRDGRVQIKMGKLTDIEKLYIQLENAVTEEELETAYVEGVNSL